MKFTQITLTNIGPYIGKNTFNLNSTSDKNTVLLGGKNGAGKTTLLHSTKLALYGSMAYGYRTNSDTYIKKVLELLNNTELKKPSNIFQIKLEFLLTKELREQKYTIVRSWEYQKDTLVENVTVSDSDRLLSPVETDDFFDLLRTKFPPSLIELCFFDGEEILQLTEGDMLSSYLRELSYSLFNIDLFYHLEQDLKTYTMQSVETKEEERLVHELSKIKKKVEQKKNDLESVRKVLAEKQQKVQLIKEENEKIKAEFKLHGGLFSNEREEVQQQVLNLQNRREILGNEIKDFIAYQLPFYLIPSLLNKLQSQLKSEENFHVTKSLEKKIKSLPIHDIIKKMNLHIDDQQEEILQTELINQLTDYEEIDMIHNLSNSETQYIFNIFSKINLYNLNEIIDKVKEHRELLEEIQRLRDLLRDHEENSEFSDLLTQLGEGNQKINKLDSEIAVLEKEKFEKLEILKKFQSTKARLERELLSIQRKRTSFIEAEKIKRVSNRFRKIQLQRKIKDVEYFTIKMIKKVMRKKNFIQKIHINPETFETQLFDKNQQEINMGHLSAGETQILVLCIIWGAMYVSKKRIPFIFDTVFGRLDLDHKRTIVKELIPEFGEQVLILATNSEITPDLYEEIKESVAIEYTLVYNDDEARTYIHSGFFSKSEEASNS